MTDRPEGEVEAAIAAAWETLADAYAERAPDKPHNAHYDRPAVLSLLPDLTGARAIDIGCGPGLYAEALLARGAAEVIGFDASEKMVAHARARLAGRPGVTLSRRRIEEGLPAPDGWADLALAPLCLDYVADWDAVCAEVRRVLRPGGAFVMSVSHPDFDAEYFRTERYFDVEPVDAAWSGFGPVVRVPGFRRPLAAALNPILSAGLILEKVLEPLPTEAFRAADPKRHAALMRRPGFLMLRARKP